MPQMPGQDADPAGRGYPQGGQGVRRELRRLFRLSSLRNEEDVPMAERKQEHTTHLLGAAVVIKTHPRIELRGRLDSLNAAIIRVQIQAREAGCA